MMKLRSESYVGFGTVVTADVCVFLTEHFVKLQLPKVCKQLKSSALHHVLTEVHHAVQIVEMSRLGVSVTFFVHCEKQTSEYTSTNIQNSLTFGLRMKLKSQTNGLYF